MTRHRLQALAAVSAAALLTGCGSSSITGSTSLKSVVGSRVDHGMVLFARCMRAHGIAMRDPFHRPGHDGLSIELPERGPATTDAYNACGHYLQPLIELKSQAAAQRLTPAVRLALIHYAQCMRSHAIAMLDPDPLGQLSLGNVPGINNGIGRYTPQFHAADHVCRRVLPPSFHDDGTGP